MESMPALREFLEQDYAPPVELQGFRVYELQSGPKPTAGDRP